MEQNVRMLRPSSFLRRTLPAVFAGALLLTACGSSGGSDSSKDTTTTAASKTTTTADDTTTTAADSGDDPTPDQLAALLPTAEEVGGDWTLDESDNPADSAIEAATEEQCPGAAALLAPAADDEPTVAFTTETGQTLRITLATGAEEIGAEQLQGAVDEINDCDAVTAEDGGYTYTASFSAAPNDTYGDEGVQISAAVNITDGTDSYDVTKYRLLFRDGSVGVTITGGDGLTDDGTVTPIDTAGLEATATEMAKRVDAL